MANRFNWQCDACDLLNSPDRSTCIACFSDKPSEQQATTNDTQSYSNINKHELFLLITGYIRNKTLLSNTMNNMAYDIIRFISSYYWPPLYEQFNAFKFKKNTQTNEECDDFDIPKYLIIPIQELKSKYLLPFNEIIYDKNKNIKIGKYSGINSIYCPSFLKPNNFPIHSVNLDKMNENIYHLIDSFLLNKFIELFPTHHVQPSIGQFKSLPKGKGPYRAGFHCLGQPKQSHKTSLYFQHTMKCRNVWRFIGGDFKLLQLSKTDFNNKCLWKQFGIDLKENKLIIDMLYNGLIHKWNHTGVLGFDDICKLSINGWWDCQIITFLNCKQIICAALYDIVATQLSKHHWITQKLIKWKLKLNVDSSLQDANVKLEANKNDVSTWTSEMHASWQEIQVIDNDIKIDIYPFLMSEIIFSNVYGYGEGKASIYSTDWNKQRVIIGEMFLKLFERNEKNNKIRAFWTTNIGWDFFQENYFSDDRILCCLDNDKIVAIWYKIDIY
eukprot:17116_1